MDYRLNAEESVTTSIRRASLEQIDLSIEQLTDAVRTDPVQAVHCTRKALKRQRALLRLAAGSLDRRRRRRHDAELRDAGRLLSGARDADVMIQALSGLSERYAGQVPKSTFTRARRTLQADRTKARRHMLDSGAVENAADKLRGVRHRAEHLQLRHEGWDAIDAGLMRSYRRGRKAMARARKTSRVEDLHDWRKRAKDLWYHLQLLEPLSPAALKGLAGEAHHLSDLLGDDHDLAVLRDNLIDGGSAIRADTDALVALIDTRREQLQAQSRLTGARLYAEPPKAFRRRLHRYWKAWRSEQRLARARRPATVADATRTPASA